jgi:metal-responsive CopG/Arc/MetJ family transcriptional regulator
MRHMIRTQIQLRDEQARALKRAADERGVSMAEVIRQAVDRYVASGHSEPRRHRAIAAIGGFRSGHRQISSTHDEHLADAFDG